MNKRRMIFLLSIILSVTFLVSAATPSAFAEESKSVDVKLFFLDQLRWCGYPGQAKGVRALKGSKEVLDFADMVAAELEGR